MVQIILDVKGVQQITEFAKPLNLTLTADDLYPLYKIVYDFGKRTKTENIAGSNFTEEKEHRLKISPDGRVAIYSFQLTHTNGNLGGATESRLKCELVR